MFLQSFKPRSEPRTNQAGQSLETNFNGRSASNAESNQRLLSNRSCRPSEFGATLVWRNLNVHVPYPSHPGGEFRRKHIIVNCCGGVQPGYLTAIIGTSISDINTMLSVLANRRAVGVVVQGDILLKGRQIGDFANRISGYVHKEDLLDAKLCVGEYMNFMAMLYMDRRVTRQARESTINNLLERMGMENLLGARIGHASEHSALTNGERKRLALAVQLLKHPQIIFCEEPTNGLDAFSAHQLITKLLELTQQGVSVLCSLDHPSSKIFNMFQSVHLLANGDLAYSGSITDLAKHFYNVGYACPNAYNLADHVLNVLSIDPDNEEDCIAKILSVKNAFLVSTAGRNRDVLVYTELHMSKRGCKACENKENSFLPSVWYKHLYVLWLRKALELWRTPHQRWTHFVLKMVLAVTIASCFFNFNKMAHLNVQAIQGCLFMMVCENVFQPMDAVLNTLPDDMALLQREVNAGLYTVGQYYFGNMLAMLPRLIIEPFLFVLLCYAIVQLKWSLYAFLMTVLTITLVMNISTAFSNFLTTISNCAKITIACVLPLKCILLCVSTVLWKFNSLPLFFRWIQYLSCAMYANEILSIVQWSQTVDMKDGNRWQQGNYLTPGADVLSIYEYNSDNLQRNICVLFVMFGVWHVLSYLCLLCRVLRSRP